MSNRRLMLILGLCWWSASCLDFVEPLAPNTTGQTTGLEVEASAETAGQSRKLDADTLRTVRGADVQRNMADLAASSSPTLIKE